MKLEQLLASARAELPESVFRQLMGLLVAIVRTVLSMWRGLSPPK